MKVFPTTRTPEFDYPSHNLNENDAYIFVVDRGRALLSLPGTICTKPTYPYFCYQGVIFRATKGGQTFLRFFGDSLVVTTCTVYKC